MNNGHKTIGRKAKNPSSFPLYHDKIRTTTEHDRDIKEYFIGKSMKDLIRGIKDVRSRDARKKRIQRQCVLRSEEISLTSRVK